MDSKIQNFEATISEGTRWLLELEFFNSPHIQNTLILNLYKVSNRIQHVDLLIDSNNKRLLVLLELDWWGRTFNKKRINLDAIEVLQGALSSYEIGVTNSKEFFNKSLLLMKKYLEKQIV